MSNLDEINNLREKIDHVDNSIMNLLSERAELALQVKKAKNNSVIYSPARENQIIQRLQKNNSSKFPSTSIKSIFREIIGASRNLEKKLRVSYLGPEGTYSHEAAQTMFGSTCEFMPELTLSEVLRSAEAGTSDIAFLPIENSSEGAIIESHRLLLNTQLQICGETTLPIRHCLLSKERDLKDISTVYAHSQALGQCREWLQNNLPNAKLISETSNSQAARVAAIQPNSAAIAGRQASVSANIPILLNGINDFVDNQTRFISLGTYKPSSTGNDKTTLIFSVGDKVGALFELLGIFAKHKISLTRLESQPQPGSIYMFYLDFDGHQDTPQIAKALTELTLKAKTCKILGSYPRGS